MEKLYGLKVWPDDQLTKQGSERFNKLLETFESLLNHEYVAPLAKRKKVSVLDLCGGAGIACLALAKKLSEKGVKVDLTVLDIRESALRRCRDVASKLLGMPVETVLMDAREAYRLGRRFEVILFFGCSAPHFTPWDMCKVRVSSFAC